LTQTPVSGLSSGVSSIAAGQNHACAVTTGGDVTCWGTNASGELGDGTTTERPTPTLVSRLGSDVASIVAGGNHVCTVTTGGAARCSGFNAYGQLGDGTTTTRLVPTPVIGLGSGVTAIAVGSSHTCALTTGGAVRCWGYNTYGQLGDGTTINRSTPTQVGGLESGVLAIAAGYGHTCAVTTSGAVECWGYNVNGQLGDGTTTNRPTPTLVSGFSSGVPPIAAGYFHTCAVTAAGGVVCWGSNSTGQLGDGTYNNRSTPTPVFGLASGVATVAAASYHTCAVTSAGGAKCWGYNSSGQLGDGTTTERTKPTPVSGLASGVSSISAASNHSCAVTTGGGALCWGGNGSGQLGDGTHESRLTPTPVSGLASGTAAIAAGNSYTCALTTGVGVTCWGNNSSGQFGTGARVVGVTPLAAYGFGGAIAAGTIAPGHGSAVGGTPVTITGAYFLQGATVTIGGVAATPVSVVSTTEILAVTGPHAAGAVDAVVTNPDAQQATLAGGFTYDAAVAPRGDFTGDLKSDLLWRHATLGDVWVWPMDGATRITETFVRTIADSDWEIRGQGDQDGDGKADLLWRNKTSGQIYFWPMNGTTPLDEIFVGTVDPAYDIVGTGDFDGDGKSDILWRHTTLGDVWIWLMDGAAAKPGGQVYIDRVDPAYVVKGVGDLDADTKADIVWHHATTGEVWVWLMDGTTRVSETWVATVPDVGYQIVGVADYTGEGKADILWHHTSLGEVWLWPMDGTTRLSETWVETVSETDYQIVGTGDYNGDMKADILWHHATRGEVWVWLMDGTTKVSETWVATVPDLGYQIIR
jgi:alpha-tubulin suppressor-like RCC1 family protein